MVGAIGFVVDFGTFNVLRNWLGLTFWIAQTISFLLAATNNFLWNRFWTYPDSRSKPVDRQAAQFLIVSALGWLIRIAVLYLVQPATISLAESLLPEDASGSQILAVGENMALVVAVLVVLLWNFSINRVWTYSDVQ